MSAKLEYDSTLGGPAVVPTALPTYRYAASALNELRQLVSAVRNPTSTKLLFQMLPKQMRRRAMSHHPKRLPRKYREAHLAQMAKAGLPQQSRRPSRKYRRRPCNLLRSYVRRQRHHIWLETHIWHARRFHMVQRWGYQLPYASCDKTYRACYRATSEHCLLQDISFYACLQLRGTCNELRAGFARLTSVHSGLSITATTYVSGRREGVIDLFRDGQYPYGALARTHFMWRPADDEENDALRTLWLWVHPSAYLLVLEELIKVFDLTTSKVALKTDTQEDKTQAPLRLRFMTKQLAHQRNKIYENASQTLELRELKDTLNRFRLTGPLAHSVLLAAFKPAGEEQADNWLHTYHASCPHALACHAVQTHFWTNCRVSSPAELLSNMIVALNIEDPRLNRPSKRSKAPMSRPNGILTMLPSSELPCGSALWQADMREQLCTQMVSTQRYHQLRARHVAIPGASIKCIKGTSLQPVPVLLVQRPGSQQPQYKRLGYGCGWDLIIPAGYGLSVWLSLVMWGARPGGLRETESLMRELGTEPHLPDSVAGECHQQFLLYKRYRVKAKRQVFPYV